MGISTTNLPAVTLADDVIVNREGSTARQSLAALATQLSLGGALAEAIGSRATQEGLQAAIDNLEAVIESLEGLQLDLGPIYEDTAAGLAATVEGQQFRVETPDPETIAHLIYQHDAGPVATLVATVPSATALAGPLTALENLIEAVGMRDLGATVVTQGDTAPNTSSFTVGLTLVHDETLTDDGLLSAVSVRLAAAGTGEIHVFKPAGTNNWVRSHLIPTTHAAGGVHTFSVENGLLPFGVKVFEGGMIGYKAITGALRYEAGGGHQIVTSVTGVVGEIVYRASPNAFAPAIEIEVLTGAETINGRLGVLEDADPVSAALQLGYEPQRGIATVTHGDTAANTSNLTGGIVAPVEVADRDGVLQSVSFRSVNGGTLRVEVYEPTGDGVTFECVASWPATVLTGGVVTFHAGDGVIPDGFWLKAGGFAAINTLSPLTARGRYAAGTGGWISVTGAGGLEAIASRTLNTNGFVVAVAFTYRGPEASIDSRLSTLEAAAAGSYEDMIKEALMRVAVNYGLTPTLAERAAYALGDSTVAEYSGNTAIIDLMDSARTVVDVSVPGDTINQQLADWNALTIDPAEVGWVIIQVGLNDMNPAEAAATAIARLQALVDQVLSDVGAAALVFISQMVPCRARLIAIYGGTDGPIAYQKWLDMNEAIAGNGVTPITGVDGRITAHVALMNDGSGNLAAAYDTGDGIHPNNAGRQINATAWRNALIAAGLVV